MQHLGWSTRWIWIGSTVLGPRFVLHPSRRARAHRPGHHEPCLGCRSVRFPPASLSAILPRGAAGCGFRALPESAKLRCNYTKFGVAVTGSERKRGSDASAATAVSPAETLDLENYVPFFLGAIANKWTAVSSRTYRSNFDLGIGEWRILASLAASGSATSLAVAKLVKMDAGAVSRAIRVLEERGLVIPLPGRFVGRSRPYAMTADGVEMFGALKVIALKREQRLLEPLSDDERKHLLRLLACVYDHLEDIER